jgi:hypothetical protein
MAVKGYGADVHYNGVNLASAIVEIVPPVMECDDIDTSHLQSTDMAKTYISGWIEGGECEVTAHYDRTEYAAMLAAFGQEKSWVVTINDATSPTADAGVFFLGYIKALGPTIDMEGLVETTITIKVTGKPSAVTSAYGI